MTCIYSDMFLVQVDMSVINFMVFWDMVPVLHWVVSNTSEAPDASIFKVKDRGSAFSTFL
jgi:hypothetical protein